jgi:plasmid stabilization system protein ParE
MSALDEVIAYISQDSPDRAGRVLTRALETAASLSSFAERGRIVREVGDPTLRQLLVYDYRLMYRVHDERVVIQAGTLEILRNHHPHVHGGRRAAPPRPHFHTFYQEHAAASGPVLMPTLRWLQSGLLVRARAHNHRL